MGLAQKANPVGLPHDAQDNPLVLMRARLRLAIERSGWKHEAIVATMRERGCPGMDAPYFSKILAGEKTLTAQHICALPDDIEAIYSKLSAERFGAIVVEIVDDEEARRQLVTGLMSLLSPNRIRMAKAGLR